MVSFPNMRVYFHSPTDEVIKQKANMDKCDWAIRIAEVLTASNRILCLYNLPLQVHRQAGV